VIYLQRNIFLIAIKALPQAFLGAGRSMIILGAAFFDGDITCLSFTAHIATSNLYSLFYLIYRIYLFFVNTGTVLAAAPFILTCRKNTKEDKNSFLKHNYAICLQQNRFLMMFRA